MEAPTAKVHKAVLSRWRGVPQWRITVTDASNAERTFHLVAGSSMRAGTNPHNDIALQDETVSRVHAELTGEAQGVRIRDLGSTNGCWLNDARMLDGIISAGTVIFGSKTKLSITSEEAAMEALEPVQQFGPLVGKSASMRALFKTLANLSSSDATVLIVGESGSGKEIVARALHDSSDRKDKPYVVFDCAAVAPTLIESALFGHEKGAFTGAASRQIGCFEEADGGTLFLDEIGELPIELQPRLLRAIERREIRRIGGDKPINVNVRVVAATHRDLARGVNAGQFREDLYYRLAVVRLRVPPLRERLDDLKLLVEHLMMQSLNNDEQKVKAMLAAMTEQQWTLLREHPWRGNIRELRNAVDRAVATAAPVSVTVDSGQVAAVKPAGPSASEESGATTAAYSLDIPFIEQRQHVLERFEKNYLQAMVTKHQGNFSRAAANAGLDRMYFKRLLKKWGLTRENVSEEPS